MTDARAAGGLTQSADVTAYVIILKGIKKLMSDQLLIDLLKEVIELYTHPSVYIRHQEVSRKAVILKRKIANELEKRNVELN